ncbi:ABC transporter permease [Adhaeretor mobilis]|uniref:Oligopeptide transport system permease protein OppC n=1 Tax=Adhaeretor mobilis TaxID=1930276 RepID=A0A517MSM5_9BACT|nr:ABC transporter permease [Adhaeretor mobilis]QDS97885.1 Dipeptide transport system permease protein DppC [Adhaeretor mobilis]
MEPNQAGNSLGKDAWRKLRRNRAAMGSLVWLVVIGLLAAVTPLLPLQAPDTVQMAVQYTEPTLSPVWLHTFNLDTNAIAETPALVEQYQEELVTLQGIAREKEQELDQAARQLPGDTSVEERAESLAPYQVPFDEAYELARRKHAQIEDTIQAPYRKLGFAPLNGISRQFVKWRYAIFGNRSLNSICGRDVLGRDLLSRVFWGARVSLVVGLVATFVSLVIGVTYGAVAGYFGGWIDDAMMRFVDVLYSVPFIFVVIFIITILGEESVARELAYWGIGRITIFFVVVGAIYWLTMSRVVRGQVISLKNEPFIEAARSLGAGHARIIFRHILPNVFSVVLVYLTLTIPKVMLFEAFLSFLGLGVEPPNVSWGLLANEGIKVMSPVKIYWWLILFPSLALGSTLLALNLLGDGLRDALDPKLRKE